MISCSNNDKDSEYLTQFFSESINALIREYYSQYDSQIENTKITFQQKSIEIIPYLEKTVQKDNQWLCGVRYEILINNKKREEFNYGTVGVGDSKEDAIEVSVIEWISLAGLTLFDYFFNTGTSFELEKFKVYHGFTGIRGDEPGGWLDGSKDMHIKLLGTILNSITVNFSPVSSVSLLIFKEPNNIIDGECKINGQISQKVLTILKLLKWPERSSYSFKQFYILVSKGAD
jgi:hypothetical protein